MKHILLQMLSWAIISLAAAQTVVINEIAWMGTQANYNDEWIELYNLTGDSIDLTNWKLRAIDGTPQIVLQGRILPHGYFVLERSDDQTISDYPADQIYTGTLGNDGEHLILEDPFGSVMDQVNCSSGWFAGQNSPVKFSMEKKHPWAPSSSASSWGDNNGIIKNGLDAKGQPINGTPGARNSIYVSTDVPRGNVYTLETYSLSSFPNPFYENTIIRVEGDGEPWESMQLFIYDLLGRKITTLRPHSTTLVNHYEFCWNGCDQTCLPVPAGVYFVYLSLNGRQLPAHRLIKMRAR